MLPLKKLPTPRLWPFRCNIAVFHLICCSVAALSLAGAQFVQEVFIGEGSASTNEVN